LIVLIDLLGDLALEIDECGLYKLNWFLFRKFFWVDQWSNFMSHVPGSGNTGCQSWRYS